MKNNVVLIILFTLASFFSMVCLTIFNSNFIIHKMDEYNYVDKEYDSLVNYLKTNSIDFKLKKSDFKTDIEKYVKRRYKKYYIHNKIESSTNTDTIYLDYVKFNNVLEKYNVHLIIYICFIVTIILVIITGNIFLKTKNKHNLDSIFIISSIILIGIYGLIYLLFNTNNEFFNYCIDESLHYLLGLSIILLDIVFIKKIWVRIKN